jgi:hypothetical protein
MGLDFVVSCRGISSYDYLCRRRCVRSHILQQGKSHVPYKYSILTCRIFRRQLQDFYVGFVTVGILQILCACLAFLLPNESLCDDEDMSGTESGKTNNNNNNDANDPCGPLAPFTFPRTFPQYYSGSAFTGLTSSYLTSSYLQSSYGSSKFGEGCGPDKDYKCNCPICIKIGCIPECSGCVPGGLSQGG